MTQNIQDFVVSIHNQRGKIQGTGFVVDKQTVVTCVHVVEAAEGDAGKTVKIGFAGTDEMVIAEVFADGYHRHNDVSILILPEDLPVNIKPAILGMWQQAEHKDFWSIGYRPLGRFQGVPAEGQILGRALEVKSEPAPTKPIIVLSSQQINSGMSGSPVYAPSIDRVVGMITAIWNKESSRRDRDTAFAISAEAIVEAWSRLSLKPPGITAPAELKPQITKIKSPIELELEERCEDYDFLNANISIIRQQIKETSDLARKDELEKELRQGKKERRKIAQRIQQLELQMETIQLGLLINQLDGWKQVHHLLQEVFEEVTKLSTALVMARRQITIGAPPDSLILQVEEAWAHCQPKLVSSSKALKSFQQLQHEVVTEYLTVDEVSEKLTYIMLKEPQLGNHKNLISLTHLCTELTTKVLTTLRIADLQILDLINHIERLWKTVQGGSIRQ